MAYGFPAQAKCSESGDQYGRKVCRIEVNGMDVNLEQVRRGMAWVYVKYANDPAYFRAEIEARKSKVGLWSDPAPVAPWSWRNPM